MKYFEILTFLCDCCIALKTHILVSMIFKIIREGGTCSYRHGLLPQDPDLKETLKQKAFKTLWEKENMLVTIIVFYPVKGRNHHLRYITSIYFLQTPSNWSSSKFYHSVQSLSVFICEELTLIPDNSNLIDPKRERF